MNLHSAATKLLSSAMIVLGLAMLVATVAGGGGPIAMGVLVGLMFVGVGAGRLYLERKRP